MDFGDWVCCVLLLLLLLSMLFMQIYAWVVDGCGRNRFFHRAAEAAEAGDTADMLRWLRRMRERAPQKPGAPTPELVAGSLVVSACEWGHPETAQAVLDELGLQAADLLWEEKGREPIPLMEYLRREPGLWAASIEFLTRGSHPS